MRSKILFLTADAQLAEAVASSQALVGKDVVTRPSLEAVGRLSALGDFDLIIADYELEGVTANEVAEYVDVFFKSIPVFILTDDATLAYREIPWAASIQGVFRKEPSIDATLSSVLLQFGKRSDSTR